MSLLHRAPAFQDAGRAYSLARNYEAWLKHRHDDASRRLASDEFAPRRIPVEAHGLPCAACALPRRILWGASADDALFCDDCLSHTGPAEAWDELGGSG